MKYNHEANVIRDTIDLVKRALDDVIGEEHNSRTFRALLCYVEVLEIIQGELMEEEWARYGLDFSIEAEYLKRYSEAK